MAGLQGWQVAGKSWTAFAGALVTALLPIIGQVAGYVPAPYGAILSGIGGVLSLLTGVGTYHAPYAPVGTTPFAPPAPPVEPPAPPRSTGLP